MPPVTRSARRKNATAIEKSSSSDDHGPIDNFVQLHDLTIHEFYHEVLKLLSRSIASLKESGKLAVQTAGLADRTLEMLYMWAHGLDLQHFEKKIPTDFGLQALVAESLVDIAQTLASNDVALDRKSISSLDTASFLARHCAEDDLIGNKVEDTDFKKGVDPRTSMEQLFERIHAAVAGLMDLLPTIDSCCREEEVIPDSDEPSDRSALVDVSDDAQPYIMQVRDKFRNIGDNLARRLGAANRDRFCRLRILRDQTEVGKNPEQNVDTKTISGQSNFVRSSTFHDSGLGASLSAQLRYASSNATHKSFLSTRSAASRGAPRVPPTPVEIVQGLSFFCNICGTVQHRIRNRVEWKMHVFADLQPYICTFDKCTKVNTTFATRKLWAIHEFNEHRNLSIWRCFECKKNFTHPDLFFKHEVDIHSRNHAREGTHASVMAKSCEISLPPSFVTMDCPICMRSGFGNEKEFVTHVCRHMEEIALIVLPSDDDSDDESDAASAPSSTQSNSQLLSRQLDGPDDEDAEPKPFDVEEAVTLSCRCLKHEQGLKTIPGPIVACTACRTLQHSHCYGIEIADSVGVSQHICDNCRSELKRFVLDDSQVHKLWRNSSYIFNTDHENKISPHPELQAKLRETRDQRQENQLLWEQQQQPHLPRSMRASPVVKQSMSQQPNTDEGHQFDSQQIDVMQASMQQRQAQQAMPALTSEDKTVINQHAAKLAKSTSQEERRAIVEKMTPQVRANIEAKNIDPIIHHFRMAAERDFRQQQQRQRQGGNMNSLQINNTMNNGTSKTKQMLNGQVELLPMTRLSQDGKSSGELVVQSFDHIDHRQAEVEQMYSRAPSGRKEVYVSEDPLSLGTVKSPQEIQADQEIEDTGIEVDPKSKPSVANGEWAFDDQSSTHGLDPGIDPQPERRSLEQTRDEQMEQLRWATRPKSDEVSELHKQFQTFDNDDRLRRPDKQLRSGPHDVVAHVMEEDSSPHDNETIHDLALEACGDIFTEDSLKYKTEFDIYTMRQESSTAPKTNAHGSANDTRIWWNPSIHQIRSDPITLDDAEAVKQGLIKDPTSINLEAFGGKSQATIDTTAESFNVYPSQQMDQVSSEKEHRCRYCNTMFATVEHRIRHERTPEHCRASYLFRPSPDPHNLTDTTVMTVQCQDCSKSFNRMEHLRKHRRIFHAEDGHGSLPE